MSSQSEATLRWWEHPDRPCLGDERYADLNLTANPRGGNPGAKVYKVREAMKQACYSCPVYFDCLTDVLSRPDYELYGIQAGIQGKT